MMRHDAAVFIGRLQPLHNGHLVLLQKALALAARVIVVLGSAHQARTPKNPFTWQERADMVRAALGDPLAARVDFAPLRDFHDEARWVHAVRREVARRVGGATASIALVGHFKDATSSYLGQFAGWELVSVDRVPDSPDGAALRDIWFGSGPDGTQAALEQLATQAPPATLDFLRSFTRSPAWLELAREWSDLKRYREAWRTAPYPPVFVTVDAVVQCANQVLLIRRGQSPGRGLLALPGGFLEIRETVYQSAVRELREETGLSLPETTLRACLEAVAVFDHPDRSQRGRTLTHVHHFDLGWGEPPSVVAADDAQAADWVPIDRIAALEDQFHDDHFQVLDHFFNISPDH
jgi:bifunctional NMN adenylyltransferase/nudix hydrolase